MRAASLTSSLIRASELIDQRPRERLRPPEIHKTKIADILSRHATNVVGLDSPQVAHETIRRAEIPLVDLRARQHGRLIGVRLVLEEVVGDELLRQPLE